MKILKVIATASILTATAGLACAQTPDYLTQNRAVFRSASKHKNANGVASNDRCGGISYGTGARSCGTATGGPVGGIGGRN